jgi:hypothetical protein
VGEYKSHTEIKRERRQAVDAAGEKAGLAIREFVAITMNALAGSPPSGV